MGLEPARKERNELQKKAVNLESVRDANEEEGFRKMNRRDRKRQEIDRINRMDIQQLEEQYKNLALNHDDNGPFNNNPERKHHHHHHKKHFQGEEESMQKQRVRGRGHHHRHHHRESHQNPFGQFYNRELSPNEESDNEHNEKSNSASENLKGEWRDKKRKYDGQKRLPRQQWEKQRRQFKDNYDKKPRREEWENKKQKVAAEGGNPREGKWEKRKRHQMEREERQDMIEKERENRADKINQARQQRQEEIQQRRQDRQNRNKSDRYEKRGENRGNRNRQDLNPNNNSSKNIPKELIKANEPVHQEKEIPEYLICPITQELMNAPMILATCGHTFQEAIIRQWLQKEGKCPLCQKPSQQQHLIKNFALAEVCRAHK